MQAEKLERRIGHHFDTPKLLTQAVTHRSFGARNNERLEFLGDAILGFVVAEDLYRRFPDAVEGQLSRLRARIVKRTTLAEVARELELGDFLIMGSGELKSGGFDRNSILADAVEGIIGAIYLDAGLQPASAFIKDKFASRLEALSLSGSLKDAKSRLQEYLQGRQVELPEYQVVEVTGESHQQTFLVSCDIELLDEGITAQGTSRRTAEQKAAALMLIRLGVEHEQT